jgi:hypothetical protein
MGDAQSEVVRLAQLHDWSDWAFDRDFRRHRGEFRDSESGFGEQGIDPTGLVETGQR